MLTYDLLSHLSNTYYIKEITQKKLDFEVKHA